MVIERHAFWSDSKTCSQLEFSPPPVSSELHVYPDPNRRGSTHELKQQRPEMPKLSLLHQIPYLSSEAGTLRGAPCSFQSGMSSCNALGSRTLPDNMCAPAARLTSSHLTETRACQCNRIRERSSVSVNTSARRAWQEKAHQLQRPFPRCKRSGPCQLLGISAQQPQGMRQTLHFRLTHTEPEPAYMVSRLAALRNYSQVLTCLSLMAAERPAGPAPTMHTSYSIASLASRLSTSADMLRDPASTCGGQHR